MTTTEQQLMWALFLCGALIVALGFAVAQIAALMKILEKRNACINAMAEERDKLVTALSESQAELALKDSQLKLLKTRLVLKDRLENE